MKHAQVEHFTSVYNVKQREGVPLTGPCDAMQPRQLITTETAFCHTQVLNVFLFRWTCYYSWTHVNFQSQIQRCGSSYQSKKYINKNLIVATGPQRQIYDSPTSFGNTFLLTLNLTLFPTESVHFSPSCKATYCWKNDKANHLAQVVQTLDSAIHRINHYPVDSIIDFCNTYPLDSDLFGG